MQVKGREKEGGGRERLQQNPAQTITMNKEKYNKNQLQSQQQKNSKRKHKKNCKPG